MTYLSLSAQCGNPMPDGKTCASAILLCGDQMNGLKDKLPQKSSDPSIKWACNGSGTGTFENSIWYAFVPCSSTVEIEVCPSNCTTGVNGDAGMQASIMSACAENSALVCNKGNACFTLSGNSFVAGNMYYLVVDGDGGSVCDFELKVKQGIDLNPYSYSSPVNNTISGPKETLCTTADKLHSYSASDCVLSGTGPGCYIGLKQNGYVCYNWNISPNTYELNGDNKTSLLDIKFKEEGSYTISVNRELHPFLLNCATGDCTDPVSITVDVKFRDTIYEEISICPGGSVNLCGKIISAPGVYTCDENEDCDTYIYTVKQPADVVELGEIFLCPTECYTLLGTDYCERKSYKVENPADCKVYTFELKDLSVDIIEPTNYPIVDCSNNNKEVAFDYTTNYKNDLAVAFLNAAGDTISKDKTCQLNQAGTYQFVVYAPGYKTVCNASQSFIIEKSKDTIQYSIEKGSLSCTVKQADLKIITSETISSIEWTGPGIINANNNPAQATKPGKYYVTVKGSNECPRIDSTEIEETLLPADINVDWNDLDCNVTSSVLSFKSDVKIDSVLWSGPSDFQSRLLKPNTTIPGSYILKLYASNGCDYTQLFDIIGNYHGPKYDKLTAEKWGCTSKSVSASVVYDQQNDLSFNWSTDQGIIQGKVTKSYVQVGSVGAYFVDIKNNKTGCVKRDTVEVIAEDNVPEKIVFDAESPACFGIADGKINIKEVQGGTAPYSYFLNDKKIDKTDITQLAPGTYVIQVTDDLGCEIKQQVILDAPNEIKTTIAGIDQAHYKDIITLDAETDPTFNIIRYTWLDEQENELGTGKQLVLTMEKTQNIILEVEDDMGCIVRFSKLVKLDEAFDYYMPNIFTPNGDGINDNFAIHLQNYPGQVNYLRIYDRWGEMMFEVKDIDAEKANQDTSWGWNGTYKDNPVRTGVYIFVAEVETLGIKKILKGNITLLR